LQSRRIRQLHQYPCFLPSVPCVCFVSRYRLCKGILQNSYESCQPPTIYEQISFCRNHHRRPLQKFFHCHSFLLRENCIPFFSLPLVSFILLYSGHNNGHYKWLNSWQTVVITVALTRVITLVSKSK